MPETQHLREAAASINGWIISDFPSTLAQAQLFVEKVSGFREDQAPEWRGDRSSQIFPAAPVPRPVHECGDAGVDMFIKLEEVDQEFYVRTASIRSKQQHDGGVYEQLSVLEVAPSSPAGQQLLAGALSCVEPPHSQLHLLPVQRQALAQASDMFAFLERLNRLAVVVYSPLAASEIVEKLQHHQPEPDDASPPASGSADDHTADYEQACASPLTNVSVKAARAVVERVHAFERAYVETTEKFADMLRHGNLSLYQREHNAKHMLRQYMQRAANFQELWDRFCDNFHEIEADFRFDAQVADELALRCELARKALWQSAEQRLEENMQLLKSVSEDGWQEAAISRLDRVTAYMIQAEVNRFEVACGLVSDMNHLSKPVKTSQPLESSRSEAAQEYTILLRHHWEQPLEPQAESSVATGKKSGKESAAAATTAVKESESTLPRVETLSAVTGPDTVVAAEKVKQVGKDGKQPATGRKRASATAAVATEAEPLNRFPQVAASMILATNVIAPWTEEQFKLPEAESPLERVVALHRAIWVNLG
jgi:hypothetical protein